MNPRVSQAIAHGLKVGLHILVAIVIIGALSYLQDHQAFFASYLTSFGVPVAVVNMVIAAVMKFLQDHEPTDTTIDTAPPANVQS